MRRCRWRLRLLLATLVLWLSLPASACAHATIPELEGFSAGALHPLTVPAQLLIIVAFGLLTGQRPPPINLKTLFILFAPMLAFALTLTATGLISGIYQPVLTGIALCAAIPVALEKPVSPLVYRALTSAAALAIGFDSAPGPSSASSLIKTLAGTGIMVIFLVFDLAYFTTLAMRRPWLRVGVRVLGSWIIAISFWSLPFPCFDPPPKWPRRSADSRCDANVCTLGFSPL